MLPRGDDKMKISTIIITMVVSITIIFMINKTTGIAIAEHIHNVTPTYFLDYRLNHTKCLETFEEIPSEYYKGVRGVTVYMNYTHPRYVAYYTWWGRTIVLTTGCVQEHMIHELTHHKNKMDGYTYDTTDIHGDVFMDAYVEILGNMTYRY